MKVLLRITWLDHIETRTGLTEIVRHDAKVFEAPLRSDVAMLVFDYILAHGSDVSYTIQELEPV